MEDPAVNSRKIRVVFTDPDATDSSSDESETPRKKSKRKSYEVILPTVKIPGKLGFVSDESPPSPEKNFAGVRNRNRDSPNWLDTFWTAAAASKACFGKRRRKVRNQLRDKRGRWIGSEKDSPTSILDVESSDDGSSGDAVKEGASGEGKFGYLYGVRVVDENGFLLGEFSKLDDLSICTGEDGAILAG